MYQNLAVSSNCEKQSLFAVELKNLTTKQKKTSLQFSCGFLYNSTVFRMVEILCAMFKSIFAEKNFPTHLSCFNQNAKKTKLNCTKKHIFSTAQKDIYYNFHWLIADLASSLEVVQVRFAFVSAGCEPSNFYALLFGKCRMLVPFVFKIKVWQVPWTSLLGPSLHFPLKYWWNVKIYFFQPQFCHAIAIGFCIFHFSQVEVYRYVFLLTAFVHTSYLTHFVISSYVIFVDPHIFALFQSLFNFCLLFCLSQLNFVEPVN